MNTIKHLIQARYENIIKEEKEAGASGNRDAEARNWNSFLEKDLEAALDSFDNLFCRRCLVSMYLQLFCLLRCFLVIFFQSLLTLLFC